MGQKLSLSNLKKTYYYFKRNGIKNALIAAAERLSCNDSEDYSYEPPAEELLCYQRERQWKHPVLISILVPAYETKEEYLRVLVDSLLAQTYPNWELILADAGKSNKVADVIKTYSDSRIHYYKLERNAGISENTNQALEKATGDYVGLLDHDDYLTPDALYEVAAALEESGKDYGFLYTDEDKCDENGNVFYEPHKKLKFNLDLFLTNNYICHFLVMKRALMQKLRFRADYDGAQDYDLCLRAVQELWEKNPKVEEEICHIPKVLYHWRCHRDSTAANPQSKQYAYEAGRRALESFVKTKGWKAEVTHRRHVGFYRVTYEGGVFAQRPDVAVCGGKGLNSQNKIWGSIYDEEGQPLYQGIPAAFGGYLHRAVLSQDASELELEFAKINPNLIEKVETFRQEITSNTVEEKEIQRKLCKKLREQGYRLYWDPDWMFSLSGNQ